jgi:hypothetical protein
MFADNIEVEAAYEEDAEISQVRKKERRKGVIASNSRRRWSMFRRLFSFFSCRPAFFPARGFSSHLLCIACELPDHLRRATQAENRER